MVSGSCICTLVKLSVDTKVLSFSIFFSDNKSEFNKSFGSKELPILGIFISICMYLLVLDFCLSLPRRAAGSSDQQVRALSSASWTGRRCNLDMSIAGESEYALHYQTVTTIFWKSNFIGLLASSTVTFTYGIIYILTPSFLWYESCTWHV